MPSLNPTVRIILFVFFAVLLPGLHDGTLAVSALLAVSLAVFRGAADFGRFMRRARWLLLSMLFIYAYFTPGEYVSVLPDAVAPTFEGLSEGGLQVTRLVATLAAISLLLSMTSREQLVAGVRHLLQPLQILNFSPDRFAVRLWLTLHYVEHWPPGTLRHLRRLDSPLQALPALKAGPEQIELLQVRWNVADVLSILFLPLIWWGLR